MLYTTILKENKFDILFKKIKELDVEIFDESVIAESFDINEILERYNVFENYLN